MSYAEARVWFTHGRTSCGRMRITMDQATHAQEFVDQTAVTVVAAELAIVFLGATFPTPLS